MNIASYIDHTNLKPTASETDIRQLCAEAWEHQFKAVCVAPSYASYAKNWLEGSSIALCTVIGFPLGYHTETVKLKEAEQSLHDGATELDMVINISRFKSMAYLSVAHEITQLCELVHQGGALLKVIIETAYLDSFEIRTACEICVDAQVDFVKTSTGFAPKGAEVETVKLIRSLLPSTMQVKASGGIKTYEQAIAFIEAGATRLGTSSGVELVSN
ncbi:MAG: deoxyribose-phosphate aldolase [Spirosomataceae bacterium]